mmetsp:Transcript_22084/g.67960  ORF Transcript_22084/g.67960 Transcript_22084/m.67960 type:complete len:228 (-) Transcript_22084:104-787(-)
MESTPYSSSQSCRRLAVQAVARTSKRVGCLCVNAQAAILAKLPASLAQSFSGWPRIAPLQKTRALRFVHVLFSARLRKRSKSFRHCAYTFSKYGFGKSTPHCDANFFAITSTGSASLQRREPDADDSSEYTLSPEPTRASVLVSPRRFAFFKTARISRKCSSGFIVPRNSLSTYSLPSRIHATCARSANASRSAVSALALVVFSSDASSAACMRSRAAGQSYVLLPS